MFMGETQEQMLVNGESILRIADGRYDPNGLIIDIGCGYGRVAYALHQRGFSGNYLGIDVVRKLTDWLGANFTPHAPTYRFLAINVKNERYNPRGNAEFSIPGLPCPPALVLVLSVFTHMYSVDIEHYLTQIARVADSNTLIYATFFLMNEEQAKLQQQGKCSRPLLHRVSETSWVHSLEQPLFVIGHSENWVRELATRLGMAVERAIYGTWSGRKSDRFQDVLLLRKG